MTSKHLFKIGILDKEFDKQFLKDCVLYLSRYVDIEIISDINSVKNYDVVISKKLIEKQEHLIFYNEELAVYEESYQKRQYVPKEIKNEHLFFCRFCVCVFLNWKVWLKSNNTTVELL